MKLWQPVRNTHISCPRKLMATQYNILSITRWEQWNLYYFLDFPSYMMFDDSSFLFWAKNWQYQRCILTFSSLPQDISVKATHRAVTFAESSKLQQMAHLKETPKIYFLVYRAKSSPRNQNRYAHRSIVSHAKCSFLKVFFILWKIEVESPIFMINIWVRSRRWGCLVTWICYHLIYQLIAKPGNKTGIPSGPEPYRE